MSRNLAPPSFPIPPREYDQKFFFEFLRAFTQYQIQVQNPGQGRNTFTVFTDLPQAGSSGLEVGTVCVDANGFLKIIQATNIATVTGVSATGRVGQITKTP
jgi:hypothetical protein